MEGRRVSFVRVSLRYGGNFLCGRTVLSVFVVVLFEPPTTLGTTRGLRHDAKLGPGRSRRHDDSSGGGKGMDCPMQLGRGRA